MNFVKEIILSYSRFGVKKFLIIDGGVSTHLPLKILAGTMNNDYEVKVAVTNCLGLGKEVDDLICKQPKGGHGDEGETSTMLYIREDLVHMENAVEEYTPEVEGCYSNGINKVYLPMRMTTPGGTNGNSKLATKEKGEEMMRAKVEDVLTFLRAFDDLEEKDFN